MTYARGGARGAALVVFLLSVCAIAQAQTSPISLTADQVVDRLTSDTLSWIDSAGKQRTVVLAHDATGYKFDTVTTVYGGAIRSWMYPFNATSRTATVTGYGNGGYAGFGYVVQHTGVFPCVGDDSPLGWQFPITGFSRVFVGRHHVILQLTQDYQRNCPNATRYTPVTIDWIFSTGRDNPVYAITYNPGANTAANILADDSRAPYGELNIDGYGGYNINGVAWGDRYKFTSQAAGDLLKSSPWAYTQANTVPFVKEWITTRPDDGFGNTGDATMGLVETQTFDQQDAGGARDANASPNGVDLRNLWTFTSAAKNGCGAQVMPCGDDWAYQANGDSMQCCAPNNNARLTWKTQFGFVGQTTYNSNNVVGGAGATPSGYPKKSYSVYVVIGQHTASPVEAQVAQVETMQSVTLSASVGSVTTSGPAGVADSTSVTYAPAGYNQIYGALAFTANASNQVDATINVGAGTLNKPLIIVGNFTGTNPTIVLNGTTLVADTGYFASLRTAPNELWITLNGNLTGVGNHLQINIPAGGVPSAPTVVATGSGAFVNVSWNAVAGATGYDLERSDNVVTHGWVTILSNTSGTAYGDVVSSNTAYAYRVRAKNASGNSAYSVDVATTFTYTNAIAAGGFVKAVDLAEARTVVNLVRALANQAGYAFTDAATAGLVIKAVHMADLRTALDEAFTVIGLATGGYTDAALTGVPVKAVHFQELRDRTQ